MMSAVRQFVEWHEQWTCRPGHVGHGVRRYIQQGRRNALERLLRQALPQWRVSLLLLRTAHEALDLRCAVQIARRAGSASPFLDPVEREADRTAEMLGRLADRIAALAAQDVAYPGMEQALDGEATRLAMVMTSIHELRQTVAELTLHGETALELREADAVLRSLGQVIRGDYSA